MNKPIIVVLAALALTISVGVSDTATNASAQYGPGVDTGFIGQVSPEQLEECEQLGIARELCTDVNILAKKRLTAAEEFGGQTDQDSGTAMLTTETGQMVVFIGVLGAIFGGVAAAFFLRGRPKPVKS